MVRKPQTPEQKIKNFVNSKVSSQAVKEYIQSNYQLFLDFWCSRFPISQNEANNIRKMIDHDSNVSVDHLDDVIVVFRSWFEGRGGGKGVNEIKEYWEVLYGEEYANQWFIKKQNKIKGSNNPGYQHGGKMSKWSKNYNKERTDEEYQKDLDELKNKSKATKRANPKNENTKVEYYLNRGMTQEEAERALSERQSTFSLEKCILKYGDIEGRMIWKERQDNWQNTLNSKSDEEIAEINRKKDPRLGMTAEQLKEFNRKLVSHANIRTSELEDKIKNILTKRGVEFDSQIILNYTFDTTKWRVYDLGVGRNLVEINGTFWHQDYRFYNMNDKIHGYTARDVWERDKLKRESAESQGYHLLTIWEHDFLTDKEATINKIINHLYSDDKPTTQSH